MKIRVAKLTVMKDMVFHIRNSAIPTSIFEEYVHLNIHATVFYFLSKKTLNL